MGSSKGEPRLLASAPGVEVWIRDGVMRIIPAIPDDAHPVLKNALVARRRSSLEGQCPLCGARIELDGPIVPGEVVHGVMAHDDDCVASDAGIADVLEWCAPS